MSTKEDLFIECPHCQEVYLVLEVTTPARGKRKVYIHDQTNQEARDHRCINCDVHLTRYKHSLAMKQFWATTVGDVDYESASMADVLSSSFSSVC